MTLRSHEWMLTAVLTACTLIVAQRAIASASPEADEAALAIAIVVGGSTGAFLLHRREIHRASLRAKISAAAAIAAGVVTGGLIVRLGWEGFRHAMISIPAAAAGALVMPWLMFPVIRALMQDVRPAERPVEPTTAGVAAVLALAAVAGAMTLQPRAPDLQLTPNRFPGLEISLPTWLASERSVYFENGNIRLTDPADARQFVSVRWTSGDPVQPDEFVKVATGGTMSVRDREPMPVGGHEGTTFYLEDADRNRAAVTIWNCPPDHRSIWIVSSLNLPQNALMDAHQRIVDSVKCHTSGDRPAGSRVFPTFVAPAGFRKDASQTKALVFTAAGGRTIVFDPAVAGRTDLVKRDVPPDVMATLLTGSGTLAELDGPPTQMSIHDALGHERKVWSAVGKSARKTPVQMELMAWYCDKRDMTFVGTYATAGKHEAREGVEALLPAVCHQEK